MNVSDLLENGEYMKCNVSNSSELFNYINHDLLHSSYVSEQFLSEIIKREYQYPTGIETSSLGISLPHVDAEFVNKNALIICSLNPSVPFFRMDDINTEIDVKIAFILLIKDPHMHVDTISKLTQIWQKKELLEQIYHASNKDEIIMALKKEGV